MDLKVDLTQDKPTEPKDADGLKNPFSAFSGSKDVAATPPAHRVGGKPAAPTHSSGSSAPKPSTPASSQTPLPPGYPPSHPSSGTPHPPSQPGVVSPPAQKPVVKYNPQDLHRQQPPLAKGSYGVVYIGTAPGFTNKVVIKDMQIMSQKSVDEWKKEVKVMAYVFFLFFLSQLFSFFFFDFFVFFW